MNHALIFYNQMLNVELHFEKDQKKTIKKYICLFILQKTRLKNEFINKSSSLK
jgi:hypothetical protein